MASLLSRLRIQLAQNDALPLLAVLGVLAGLMTSVTILLFRFAIEGPLDYYFGEGQHENFESLSAWLRFTLPFSGAILVAAFLHRVSPHSRIVGISHVLERLKHHQGHMPLSNLITQFVGGVISALSGQSTGREGPAVHLGAATGSIMGRKFKLTSGNNQLLLAAGVAAAISASFNTPIAGVIFAMEVIVMGYSLVSLIPVILASVTGAIVTRFFYGAEPAFTVPALNMHSLLEFPFILVEGLILGSLGALFIWICVNTAQKSPQSLWLRFLLIGLVNGILALLIAPIMGIGYDTVNQALLGQLPWLALFSFALAKLFITSFNLGLGQPGGAIGPMLFIGACAGGLVGEVGNALAPDEASATGYYAMLGMAGMMSACLQAPLTGLMTLLELTNNPNILLPGMFVVVIANLTASEVFKQKALFPRLLQLRGLSIDTSPVEHMLRQHSVLSVADKDVKVVNKFSTPESLKLALVGNPKNLVICEEKLPIAVVSAADVANLLMSEEQLHQWLEPFEEADAINLLAIPAARKTCSAVFIQSNLQEALDAMATKQVDCLTVHMGSEANANTVMGVIEHDKIHNFYRYSH